MSWAALIKKVYEVDPLRCPDCGGEMKVISFIDKCQADIVEKILRHCEFWKACPELVEGMRRRGRLLKNIQLQRVSRIMVIAILSESAFSVI